MSLLAMMITSEKATQKAMTNLRCYIAARRGERSVPGRTRRAPRPGRVQGVASVVEQHPEAGDRLPEGARGEAHRHQHSNTFRKISNRFRIGDAAFKLSGGSRRTDGGRAKGRDPGLVGPGVDGVFGTLEPIRH